MLNLSAAPQQGTIEPAPPISSLTNTEWSRPDFVLPVPSLRYLFHLECDMESFSHIGPGPHGDRSTVIFKGGRFEGPRLRGTILPGGGDWEIIHNHAPNLSSPPADYGQGEQEQSAHLDTRYNFQTHDGATIYVQTTGTRRGPKSVLEGLGDEENAAGPDKYRMRLHVTMETGDERYTWLNSAVVIASAGRIGSRVIYDAYEVL